jgi:hypothetical protein
MDSRARSKDRTRGTLTIKIRRGEQGLYEPRYEAGGDGCQLPRYLPDPRRRRIGRLSGGFLKPNGTRRGGDYYVF